MASGFPGSIDNFTDPLTTSALNSPSHAGQHQDLNDAVEKIETYMGLVKVIPTSATNGTVSATGSVTIGNGVTSVVVNGAFSSLYDVYLISVSGGYAASNAALSLQLGSTTSGYRLNYIYTSYNSTVAATGTTTGANYERFGFGHTNGLYARCTVANPFLAANTFFTSDYVGANDLGPAAGFINNSTQYTAFTIGCSAALTGGTIRVYGYRN